MRLTPKREHIISFSINLRVGLSPALIRYPDPGPSEYRLLKFDATLKPNARSLRTSSGQDTTAITSIRSVELEAYPPLLWLILPSWTFTVRGQIRRQAK